MRGMITRMFTGYNITARIINRETEVLETVKEVSVDAKLNESKARTLIENIYPDYSVVSVEIEKFSNMRGMTLETFVKNSMILDEKTRQPIEQATQEAE